MHNHDSNNGNGGHDSKMMWFMMLACMLPVVLLSLGGGSLFRDYPWVVPAGVGALIAVYMWQMFKSKNHQEADNASAVGDNKEVEPKTKPHQPGGGCCH